MAHGPRYRVPLRRRREGKTNYYKRRELLKSGRTRLVVRKSNRNMTIQFVESLPDGDKILVGTTSMKLPAYGWKIATGNIPGAYLTGYLAGKMALAAGIEDAILDLGVQVPQSGSRLYAALKGVIDAGVEVPAGEKIFPEENIIRGEHIKNYSEKLKEEDKDAYKNRFAGYLKAKQNPEKIESHFDKTLEAINKAFE